MDRQENNDLKGKVGRTVKFCLPGPGKLNLETVAKIKVDYPLMGPEYVEKIMFSYFAFMTFKTPEDLERTKEKIEKGNTRRLVVMTTRYCSGCGFDKGDETEGGSVHFASSCTSDNNRELNRVFKLSHQTYPDFSDPEEAVLLLKFTHPVEEFHLRDLLIAFPWTTEIFVSNQFFVRFKCRTWATEAIRRFNKSGPQSRSRKEAVLVSFSQGFKNFNSPTKDSAAKQRKLLVDSLNAFELAEPQHRKVCLLILGCCTKRFTNKASKSSSRMKLLLNCTKFVVGGIDSDKTEKRPQNLDFRSYGIAFYSSEQERNDALRNCQLLYYHNDHINLISASTFIEDANFHFPRVEGKKEVAHSPKNSENQSHSKESEMKKRGRMGKRKSTGEDTASAAKVLRVSNDSEVKLAKAKQYESAKHLISDVRVMVRRLDERVLHPKDFELLHQTKKKNATKEEETMREAVAKSNENILLTEEKDEESPKESEKHVLIQMSEGVSRELLEKEKVEMGKKIAELELKLKEVISTNAEGQKQLKDNADKLELSLKSRNDDVLHLKGQLEVQERNGLTKISRLEESIKMVTRRENALSKSNQNILKVNKILKADMNKMQEELRLAKNQLAQYRSEKSRQVSQKSRERDLRQIKMLQEEAESQREKIFELNQRAKMNDKKIADFYDERLKWKQTWEDKNKLELQVESLSRNTENLKVNLEKIKQQKQESDASLEAHKKEADHFHEEQEKSKATIKNLTTKLQASEAKEACLTKEHKLLDEKLKICSDNLDRSMKDSKSKEEQCNTLASDLKKAQNAIREKDDILNQKNIEMSQLKNEFANFTKEHKAMYETLKTECDQLKAEHVSYETLKTEYDQLKAKHASYDKLKIDYARLKAKHASCDKLKTEYAQLKLEHISTLEELAESEKQRELEMAANDAIVRNREKCQVTLNTVKNSELSEEELCGQIYEGLRQAFELSGSVENLQDPKKLSQTYDNLYSCVLNLDPCLAGKESLVRKTLDKFFLEKFKRIPLSKHF